MRASRVRGSLDLDAAFATEEFTPDERARLARHFTDLDGPVFALIEPARGRSRARCSPGTRAPRSRCGDCSSTSSRRDGGAGGPAPTRRPSASERAEQLYERVFVEYGDDSVAQLGGVHLACEQASQLLAKVARVGPAGRLPGTVHALHALRRQARRALALPPFRRNSPAHRSPIATSRSSTRCSPPTAGCTNRWRPTSRNGSRRKRATPTSCTARRSWPRRATRCAVLLPAGTRSNLGIYATGQSYEQLLMRLAVHPLAEMREFGDLMLIELRKVIPEFLKRVDVAERGVAWSAYWRGEPRTRRSAHRAGARGRQARGAGRSQAG